MHANIFIQIVETCKDLGPSKDMQTPFPPFRNGAAIFMTDEQCAEIIENSIFQFLYFQLRSILYSTVYNSELGT